MVTDLKTKKAPPKLEKPRKWACVILNDSVTSMKFVEDMLQKHFGHPYLDAHRLMLEVHLGGSCVAGVYPLEVAEHKAYLTMDDAERANYPLQVVLVEQ